jgi:hypothetical protein
MALVKVNDSEQSKVSRSEGWQWAVGSGQQKNEAQTKTNNTDVRWDEVMQSRVGTGASAYNLLYKKK